MLFYQEREVLSTFCRGKRLPEEIEIFGGGGPAGDEATEHAVVVVGPPEGEIDLFLQGLYQGVGDDDKLLVGGRVEVEREACRAQDVLQLFRHVDGMGGDLQVEVVGEQGIELDACQPPLGKQGSVLFDDTEETAGGSTTGEDNGFAAEGTDLGAADVEGIAVTR